MTIVKRSGHAGKKWTNRKPFLTLPKHMQPSMRQSNFTNNRCSTAHTGRRGHHCFSLRNKYIYNTLLTSSSQQNSFIGISCNHIKYEYQGFEYEYEYEYRGLEYEYEYEYNELYTSTSRVHSPCV
jgi:hypothetical protein